MQRGTPQLENGYTKIANELLEAIINVSIPARHKDIWLFVVRKTYGFNKKSDVISLSQFQKGTRIDRSGVCRILKDLVAWGLLAKKGSIYAIIKDYSKWVVAWRPLGGSGVEDNQVVACAPPTKETLTKEIKNTDSPKTASSESSKIKKDMLNHDNRKFDSDYEPVVNEDGEKVESPQNPNISKAMRELLKWAEERRGGKFINIGKQFKAMKLLRLAKINPTQIKERWEELESDKYYRQKGFDFADIANNFDKKR